MLQRFQDRGEKILLHLKMEARFGPDVTSRNIVADYQGTESEEKVTDLDFFHFISYFFFLQFIL